MIMTDEPVDDDGHPLGGDDGGGSVPEVPEETTKSLEYGKCLETGETTKSLEKSLFQGILSFFCFQTLLKKC